MCRKGQSVFNEVKKVLEGKQSALEGENVLERVECVKEGKVCCSWQGVLERQSV